MGRIRRNIEVNGKQFWTLFDSGAKNTYIISKRATGLQIKELKASRSVALGGKDHSLTKLCILEAVIQGKPIETDAYLIDSIGKDEDGKEIEILFGALAMQQWGIRLHLEEEDIDMTHYPKEFVEFIEMMNHTTPTVSYIKVIITPEQLLNETASLEQFLTWCAESEDNIDYNIKLLSFIERTKQIYYLLSQQYKIKKDKQATIEDQRKFYDKNWPDYMKSGYYSLSNAFGIFGMLQGIVEGGEPVEKSTMEMIEMLRREILTLLHEWQRKKRHLINIK